MWLFHTLIQISSPGITKQKNHKAKFSFRNNFPLIKAPLTRLRHSRWSPICVARENSIDSVESICIGSKGALSKWLVSERFFKTLLICTRRINALRPAFNRSRLWFKHVRTRFLAFWRMIKLSFLLTSLRRLRKFHRDENERSHEPTQKRAANSLSILYRPRLYRIDTQTERWIMRSSCVPQCERVGASRRLCVRLLYHKRWLAPCRS